MKLFESKKRLTEALSSKPIELSSKSWEEVVLDMFDKKYLSQTGKTVLSMPSKDVDLILREYDIRIGGKVVESNVRGQKEVKSILEKQGWKFY